MLAPPSYPKRGQYSRPVWVWVRLADRGQRARRTSHGGSPGTWEIPSIPPNSAAFGVAAPEALLADRFAYLGPVGAKYEMGRWYRQAKATKSGGMVSGKS